jgi:hypothetical protein
VRLLGVGVINLRPAGEGQLGLFSPSRERSRSAKLNRALDDIQDRFGASAIRRGALEETSRAGLSLQIKRGEDP